VRLAAYKPKRARIEIVPMIDTIFFLLVYFIIASLSMTQMHSRKVALPVSATASQHPETKVIVTVAQDGRCYIDQTPIEEVQIADALKARLRDDPSLTVVINCDKDQPVERFGEIFDLVKQANAATVMVATTPTNVWTGH
jgi:biopolymer transport protein ExbD